MKIRMFARPNIQLFGIYGLLFAMLYYSSYSWLIGHDWRRDDYNYCYFLPFVVLYLAWEKRSQWTKEPAVPSWAGLVVLLSGLLLFWLGELAGEYFTLYISSWTIAAGLLWMNAGWKKVKIMAFPLAVSIFLFPLPNYLDTKLTFNLKLISSKLGVAMIQLLGMSAYREGNIIDLGFTRLQVVDACSGLRYLFPLVLMGLLMAYFYRAAVWKRVVIALSTIPLTILTNSFRIALTAVLYPYIGRAAAEGFFHDFSGWAIFMVSFAILVAEIWLLRNIMPRPNESFFSKTVHADGSSQMMNVPIERAKPAQTESEKALFLRPHFNVATAILAVSVVLSLVLDYREKPPVSRPFNDFPLTVGGWKGERLYLEQEILDVLEFTDYISINFTKQDSMPVNMYVAYYASQQKGKSIHSPETCLPGSGWIFKSAGTTTIPVPWNEASPITVMRAMIEKGTSRQMVYFWFTQRGRVLTNAYQMKLYNFLDALTMKRTDGALIRIISPISSSEQVEDTDTRLQGFLKDVMPILNEFIPGEADPGNDRAGTRNSHGLLYSHR